jgi:hypothetical protein
MTKNKSQHSESGDRNCRLCEAIDPLLIFEDKQRTYYKCTQCDLIFVPSHQHLSEYEEKKRYDFHENDPADEKYRTFLSSLTLPLSKKLSPGSHGLDFGCGPGPAVSTMLREMGFTMEDYDPHYLNNHSALNSNYDFITCTEVVEHFRNPATDWKRLTDLVKTGGWLGVMTDLTDEISDFSNWHYRRDETHICFYSKKTFLWIANKYNYEVEFPSKRVVLLNKK